jgi:hypothetical protein
LKTLLEEERRIGEVRNVQMKKKEEDCEKLEQEVVSLRKSDPGDQILLKNSKYLKSLQIERERRPHCYEPNATCLGSNGRQEREISRSVQNDKQVKKEVLIVQSVRTLTWQAIRHVEGIYWDSWHVKWLVDNEWDGDMWPNQWPPRVTCLLD